MKDSAEALCKMKGIKPIPMLTAYTCPVAKRIEQANIPVILVGDSVGMVEMGFESTRDVTIDHMQYHIAAVRRGAPDTHIIGDMPFNTYNDPELALINARLLINAGADSVKLEGGRFDIIHSLIENRFDVVGHTGLTPQTADDFKKTGVNADDAKRIYNEAIDIEAAGAFMIVLEHIPSALSARITSDLPIPTIGIGAGSTCDGQVLVINDAAGLGDYWPPFSKQYAHIGQSIQQVAESFAKEVMEKIFPDSITDPDLPGKVDKQ